MKKIFALVAIIALFSCCINQNPIQLNGTEISEYRGEKLSSVNDFRENSIKGPQHVNITTYKLNVDGRVNEPKEYTYQQALEFQHYTKVVQLDCVEGWSAKILWEGILLKDLIAKSKPTPDANTIIFHSYDGYTTSMPLDYANQKNILLAYRMNNVTLPPERGYPFAVVAEDKWGYKWAKWVVEIEISNNSDYKGYWESNGYNKAGDLSGPFLG
jgi:DMSO/TMAO reductase YedYZ molybdopterin-dependent catalytic subunit